MDTSLEANEFEPVVELVPPMDRQSLIELDHLSKSDSDVYLYLEPNQREVFVNAEPKAEELGLPFWLKVLKQDRLQEVGKHPYYYSPGKVAVEAAYMSAIETT